MISFNTTDHQDSPPMACDAAAAGAGPRTLGHGPPRALAQDQPARDWRSDLKLLWHRLRHPHRPDLYLARLLGRPLSDRRYLEVGHLLYFGGWPDFDNPRSLNEHIMAYMLRCRDPLLQVAADKSRARQYVAAIAGEQYLVPLHGTWRNAEDVPLESLPRPCVLKPTAASGAVIFLHENEAVNYADVRAAMRRWLRSDYSSLHREWPYHGARQMIMAERLMLQADGSIPPDYKFWVIGKKVRLIHVDRGRFERHTRNLYLPDWQPANARLTLENHLADPRPPCLEEMIEVSERLARPFEFLRVDCYLIGDRPYVGELTNSPGAGFERFIPSSFAVTLGSYWERGTQPSTPAP
jgi:hypothetical protein